MPHIMESCRKLVAVMFIGLALCVMTYHHASDLAMMRIESQISFLSQGSFAKYKVNNLGMAWAGRILSLKLGYEVARASLKGTAPNSTAVEPACFRSLVGLYVAGWMGLIFFVYLIALKEQALLPMLGTFVGVEYGYLAGVADRVCSWDMPALFFYALFVCLLIHRRLVWMIPLLPIAVLYKEPAVLLPTAFLFEPLPKRRRIGLFLVAMSLAATTRLWATYATHTLGSAPLDWYKPHSNLQILFTLHYPAIRYYAFGLGWHNHPLLADAGLLVAFWIFPGRGEHLPALRLIFLLFTLLTFLFGIILEYRIWFELIPIALYPLCVPSACPQPEAES
jgi:hypothetical protein